MTFDLQAYSPPVAELLRGAPQNPLGPGQPNAAVRAQLAALDSTQLFSNQSIADPSMARACPAALWLRHDFLDQSHTISQEIETPTGSFWHGIMHRREPDYGNAKYWFRRVGRHPVFDALAAEARSLARAQPGLAAVASLRTDAPWDPCHFVDLCQQAARDHDPLEAFCQAVQQREWELLFDFCYRQALER